MDKFAGYVVVVYAVTLLLLLAYLAWIWLRLKNIDRENP